MTSKLLRFLTAAAFGMAIFAMAQTGGTNNATLPAAPSAATSSAANPGGATNTAAAPVTTNPTGTKLGTINIEQAIFASNEGQRDFDTLSKKLEPKQNELKGLNEELDNLKKQLNTQGEKLNDQSRAALVKQIEQKQKSLDRSVQDARDDAQTQQNEIAQRILQKMGPLIVKYAGDNGFGVIIDTSNPWPNGPVLWAGPSVDITRSIVEAYNTQSGVPAPVRETPAAKPGAAGTKPVTPTTKPATPPAKPQGTQPPPK